jgi:hypothetical protein
MTHRLFEFAQRLFCLFVLLCVPTVGCSDKENGTQPDASHEDDNDEEFSQADGDNWEDADQGPDQIDGTDGSDGTIDPPVDCVVPAATGMPAPFWRRGDEPACMPDWYHNQGPMTTEVIYDQGKSDLENGADLEDVLENLSAGDHVLIHAGSYSVESRLYLNNATGTAQEPIVIRGAPGEQVIITRPDAEQNVMDVDNSDYMIFEGLVFRGGHKAVRLFAVNNIIFYDNEVYEIGANAFVANSANTSFLYFIENHIHHTGGEKGEGFYLGADTGEYVTHHTFVIGNYIHDIVGPLMDQGDGIEVKYGSYAVTIKYNFIQNTNYPGIVVVGNGRGVGDRNIVEENVIIGGNDNGIDVGSDTIIRNNLIVNPERRGLRIKPIFANSKSMQLEIVNNTIINDGIGVKITGWDDPLAVGNVFANNAIYSGSSEHIDGSTEYAILSANVALDNLDAFKGLSIDGSELDATPKAGSGLDSAGDGEYTPQYDLFGKERTGSAEVGAVDIPD